jgi:cobalamin-dependent methionine synthase I
VLIIGENIHIIAPPVKAAIEARDAKVIQALALRQVEAGAGILDLNIGPQKKHGHEVMPWIVEAVQEVTDTPLSLDTTNFAAMEAGLKVCKKPAMLNSASADPARLDSVMQSSPSPWASTASRRRPTAAPVSPWRRCSRPPRPPAYPCRTSSSIRSCSP